MIRTVTISFILSLWAAPMLAQNVVVRSGEHEGFTRLVLDFPARLDWQDQTREDGITITFPGDRPTFDLSRVFDRLTQVLRRLWQSAQQLICESLGKRGPSLRRSDW